MQKSLSQAAGDISWPRQLYFSCRDYNAVFVIPRFRRGLLITQLRESLQHVMSLITEICDDDPKLKQKISQLGQ